MRRTLRSVKIKRAKMVRIPVNKLVQINRNPIRILILILALRILIRKGKMFHYLTIIRMGLPGMSERRAARIQQT